MFNIVGVIQRNLMVPQGVGTYSQHLPQTRDGKLLFVRLRLAALLCVIFPLDTNVEEKRKSVEH